ncbi:MAG: DUF2163 domain-containing protein [Pseudomonadota bacterium]
MRHVDPALSARLATGVATTCLCWRLTRADGQVFGATDHDRALSIDGVAYEPNSGVESAEFSSSAGLAPGSASGSGALSADFLTEDDLQNGVWNSARVDVFRVDWTSPDLNVQIWSGRLGEITHSAGRFAADLVSLKADLETRIGRVYSRSCDAEVGDARCGVDLSSAAFKSAGVVADVISATRLRVDGLSGFSDGWFSGGLLKWTNGANLSGVFRLTAHAFSSISVELEISRAPAAAIQIGDGFDVTAGCDKAFAICRSKFANQENFRGFPHLLGNDAVLAGPASDGRNDGGQR